MSILPPWALALALLAVVWAYVRDGGGGKRREPVYLQKVTRHIRKLLLRIYNHTTSIISRTKSSKDYSKFLGKSVFFIPRVLQKCDIPPLYFILCKSVS
jgi:hypothetical protein